LQVKNGVCNFGVGLLEFLVLVLCGVLDDVFNKASKERQTCEDLFFRICSDDRLHEGGEGLALRVGWCTFVGFNHKNF